MGVHARLWFGFLGSSVAWFFHLFAGSIVGEAACVKEGALFVFLGVSSGGWMLIAITFVSLAACLASIWVAWGFRKDPGDSFRFMGRAGLVAGLLFLAVILAQISPITAFLGEC